ncbi:hypothetical protein AAFF_G00238530 [Aldrovandia affinis]|uniref:Testicular haploid expressed gene protein-like n=1 Tax=Aldrovandia affinis TaxID=143900 RepID=A0AAD7W401_9TELE|nr:hypothetical protein AAFF_G00238530 [Aldrovandia affinis]
MGKRQLLLSYRRFLCRCYEGFALTQEAAASGRRSPMATRIEQLARPRPNLAKPDRRSVYWRDSLPVKNKGGTTTFDLTPRLLQLCDRTAWRASYQDNRRSPVWEVSSAALRASASQRVLSLAKPRLPCQGWQPDRPLLATLKASAAAAVPSSRVCRLARPKRVELRPDPPIETRPTLAALQPRELSARIRLLASPKPSHPQYLLGRPISWPVLGAAREAVASERVESLARPKLRKALFEGYDPFVVSPTAGFGIATPRILELSQPLPRKRWKK